MAGVVEAGTWERRERTDVLRFTLHLAQPVHQVWPAVATPAGLREWLAEADPLEARLGGAVTLRWLNAGGGGTVAEGTVTAWDLEHVAEYTVAGHGRVRFHLAPAGTTNGTVLRFTNEVPRAGEQDRLSRLAGWHQHLEHLAEALEGRPRDASAWTPDR
ncbi:SRPBCC domain-containing protein [Streptomyces chryseus]|uniref:SRPBCC domain-containing protein n=2 Tax=Streptomyces chryseus TaxID=68186 RepID=UPI0016770020|nr:SRPBCC domain-containing protein [Streptomyces chryseus]